MLQFVKYDIEFKTYDKQENKKTKNQLSKINGRKCRLR